MAINQDFQNRVDAYKGNPEALTQRYQQNQQLIDLLALQKIKSEKEAAVRQMQMQMSQQQAGRAGPDDCDLSTHAAHVCRSDIEEHRFSFALHVDIELVHHRARQVLPACDQSRSSLERH